MSPSRPKRMAKTTKSRSSASARSSAAPAENVRVDIDYEQLKSLTKLIQLNAVYLIEGGIQANIDPRSIASADLGPKGYTLSLGDARWWLDGSTLDISLGYRVTGVATRSGSQTSLFVINARFLVSYSLPEGTDIPTDNRDNLLADLVAANGQINAFPYLRQFVNDLTARSDWPPLVLRLFKAPARRPRGLVRMAKVWEPAIVSRTIEATDETQQDC